MSIQRKARRANQAYLRDKQHKRGDRDIIYTDRRASLVNFGAAKANKAVVYPRHNTKISPVTLEEFVSEPHTETHTENFR